jgi:hypothetical protein
MTGTTGPQLQVARLALLVASLDALLLTDLHSVTKAVVPESVAEDNTFVSPSLSPGDWVQLRKDAIALLARIHTSLLDMGSTAGTQPGV